MRLLHITASMDPKLGGVCQAVRTIIKGLNAYSDVTNEIVSFDDPNASFIGKNPYHINALGLGKTPWFYNPKYLSWLLQNLSRFDVVVLHGLWNYQGYGLIKAMRQLKRNTSFSTIFFVMPHGMLDPYFQKASGRKLKAVRNWVYWKLVEKKVISKASALLFTCEAELQLARKTFTPYQPKKELVIGLGVEEPPPYNKAMQKAFLSKCQSLNTDSYLLFISRIHEKKGTDLLVDAYGKTKAAADNLKLVVAGPGLETTYGQKIKASALKLQQPETKVFFPGMLTGDTKWGAFYGCDAFVLPSHQENFGIAVVEALACGKPVLISNQVNIWTEIEAAKAGIIANDTATGTRNLLESWNNLSEEQKKEMGKNARMCYEKYFATGPATQNFLNAMNVANT